ncbi:hypothetical protein Ancab_019914, partial [Ancistrocladus abbreviatus]
GLEPPQRQQTDKHLREAWGPISQRPSSTTKQQGEIFEAGETCKPKIGALRLKRFASFRPKKMGSNKNKAATMKGTTSRNKPNKTTQAIVKLGENRETSLEEEDAPEATRDSLHDNNIENMNRIFLNNLNHIIAEEIWEVGRHLGVHSAKDSQAVIQRISKLQGRDQKH